MATWLIGVLCVIGYFSIGVLVMLADAYFSSVSMAYRNDESLAGMNIATVVAWLPILILFVLVSAVGWMEETCKYIWQHLYTNSRPWVDWLFVRVPRRIAAFAQARALKKQDTVSAEK